MIRTPVFLPLATWTISLSVVPKPMYTEMYSISSEVERASACTSTLPNVKLFMMPGTHSAQIHFSLSHTYLLKKPVFWAVLCLKAQHRINPYKHAAISFHIPSFV